MTGPGPHIKHPLAPDHIRVGVRKPMVGRSNIDAMRGADISLLEAAQ